MSKIEFFNKYLEVVGKVADDQIVSDYSNDKGVDMADVKSWLGEIQAIVSSVYTDIQSAYQTGNLPNKEAIISRIEVASTVTKENIYRYSNWCVSKG